MPPTDRRADLEGCRILEAMTIVALFSSFPFVDVGTFWEGRAPSAWQIGTEPLRRTIMVWELTSIEDTGLENVAHRVPRKWRLS